MLRIQKTLLKTYTLIDTHISVDGVVDEEYFLTDFAEICNSNNINVVVLDETNRSILRTQEYDQTRDKSISVMTGRLQGYYMGFDTNDAKILKKTDRQIRRNRITTAMKTVMYTNREICFFAFFCRTNFCSRSLLLICESSPWSPVKNLLSRRFSH